MVGYKADEKYKHNAEYIATGLPFDRDGIPSGLEVRLEDFPRYRRVEDD